MSLILIVDDHRDTCRVVARLVRTLGWQAEAVDSGEAAVEFVRNAPAPPAVIMLDVTMPGGIDGFETLQRLRALPGVADVPVVMMSAIEGEEPRQRAVALGATEYWAKGVFEPSTLAEALARVALTRRDPPPAQE